MSRPSQRYSAGNIWMHCLIATILLSLVTACGGTQPATADDVHRQFVEALRTNNRQELDQLLSDRAKGEVEHILYLTQRQVNGEATKRYDGLDGQFQGVETLPLVDRGVGKVGVSVWRSTGGVQCWNAELAESETGWTIVHLSGNITTCPER